MHSAVNKKREVRLFVISLVMFCCTQSNALQAQALDSSVFRFSAKWRSEKDVQCCSEAKSEFEAQFNEWLKQIAPAKKPLVMAQYDSLHFYCPVYSPYEPTDSSKAGMQYARFIQKTKKLKDPWAKIRAVLKLTYETVRYGEYNTVLDTTLHTGQEKYIAYATDKLAGVCSEYASFVAAVLNDLDIHAGSINFSTTDSLGNFFGLHTTAGVALNGKIYILDPMFCTYYVDCKKNPLDFVAIYHLVQQQLNAQIKTMSIKHGPGESLEERHGCVTENTGKRFQVDSIMDRVHDFHQIEFSDPLHFNEEKEKLLLGKGYLLDYYSFFGIPSNHFDGDSRFVEEAKRVFVLLDIKKKYTLREKKEL